MTNVYFRNGGKLYRFEALPEDVGLAQVETWLFACEQGVKPEGPVLAVIVGDKES